MSDKQEPGKESQNDQFRRGAVRLTTVYGGRVCQAGKAYPCVISDVSETGAKLRIKDPENKSSIVPDHPVQLIFNRLGEYKSLNGSMMWLKDEEATMGIKFSDIEKKRHRVISALMPNRWNLVQNNASAEDKNG
ncbi:MAG: PilZ domain-containing protein [Rhodospirillaceae bacterium]|nr:PilZ domain-containing protein [Rhodospirillaceae bacterium]